MKKIIIALLICLMSCFILACGEATAPSNLAFSNRVITWDKVDGATEYVLEINNTEYKTKSNSYTLEDGVFGSLTIRVKAVINGKQTDYTSKINETAIYKLQAPTNVLYANGKIEWDEVAFAKGYIVSINGIQYPAETNSYIKQISINDQVKVLARGNLNGTLLSSEYTDISYKLATPQVNVYDTVISWDSVEGADLYEIFVGGEKVAQTSNADYDLGSSYSGTINVSVKAVSSNSIYIDSELSSPKQMFIANALPVASVSDFESMSDTGIYKLVANIDLAEYQQIASFKGTLDGNGYKFTGLTKALFDTLDGATLKNIVIENAAINTEFDEVNQKLGVLANSIVDAVIRNCKVTASINVVSKNGIGYVGGLVATSEYSILTSNSFVGTIDSENCIVGGLIGKVFNPEKTSEIKKCIVDVALTCKGGEQAYCGGFIGQLTDNSATISECALEFIINASASYVGGFVGYMGTGKIVDCYSSGSIISTNDAIAHIGGFVGRVEGYNNKIIRCISMASIVAESGDKILVGSFVGSTPGGDYATIYENCYYDSTLSVIDRIGNISNGRGDGITGKSTNKLKTLEYENGYLETIWVLGNNKIPTLACFN